MNGNGWTNAINGTNETIPPRAIAKITSFDQSTGLPVLGQVASDGDTGVVFVGNAPIPAGEKGIAYFGTPAIAAYQTDNATGVAPAHGETWGPGANSSLRKGLAGFEVVGAGGFGICNVIASLAAKVDGFTGTKSVVTDVTWDEETCAMTKTTEDWVYENGVFVRVDS